MFNALHYLKTYRERAGISLQDMARIIGMDIGNLSKVENEKLEASVRILFTYHLILKIPMERLFKNHYPEITKNCLDNAQTLKERLLDGMTTPTVGRRLITLDTIIDRLETLQLQYGS
ncbi:helix-turn-helix domain-containing protein [Polaribacter sp. MSW13]|uniref:Helix-turn-helix domain-containing protein n=1 Tax=Polaribacter marinus TaxID=2916838 RepID=A0A9X2AJX5_9FLAO|nr:helix-turn-helix transcriptional regulator [Polaribacter marinus]MCI2229931.1 helix-turn-helix domain-containing protein [Polaribacter marinus]